MGMLEQVQYHDAASTLLRAELKKAGDEYSDLMNMTDQTAHDLRAEVKELKAKAAFVLKAFEVRTLKALETGEDGD